MSEPMTCEEALEILGAERCDNRKCSFCDYLHDGGDWDDAVAQPSEEKLLEAKAMLIGFTMRRDVFLRFDGPPGPDAPRFIETEDCEGHGISVGRWQRDPQNQGQWFLIIPTDRPEEAAP